MRSSKNLELEWKLADGRPGVGAGCVMLLWLTFVACGGPGSTGVNDSGVQTDVPQGPTCGNGVVEGLEECDDGTANSDTQADACRTDCTDARCGDGVMDTDEACDDGRANLDDIPNVCRTDCSLPQCGDGVRDASYGETCDDGNLQVGDGCGATCVVEYCGNGVLDPDERCDDGNLVAGDGCGVDCLSDETCGNGLTDNAAGETCDCGTDPANLPVGCDVINGDPAGVCEDYCGVRYCGNGHPDSGEVCDDGNRESADGCSPDCQSDETCGNGRADFAAGETCDCGTDPANLPPGCPRVNGDPEGVCSASCQTLYCGNGIFNTGEVCDDGNLLAGDGCSPDCLSDETCGNGIVDFAASELCDDGGSNSIAPNADCRPDCQPRRCGDGIVDNLRLESCDDANGVGGDGCTETCFIEPHWECSGQPSVCTCADYYQGSDCATCVVYVNDDPAITVRNGLSWSTAFASIQTAANAAFGAGVSCEVWVAGSTYSQQVELLSESSLYGGFAGTETSRAQRDVTGNETIVDVSSVPSPTNNLLFAVVGSGIQNSRFDGFTVTGSEVGVGLEAVGADVVIANCTLRDNTRKGCVSFDGTPVCGASGLLLKEGSPTIENTLITGNGSSCGFMEICAGGGVFGYNTSASLINCTLADNSQSGVSACGGGICAVDGGVIEVVNSVLWGNSPDDLDLPFGLPNGGYLVSHTCLQASHAGTAVLWGDPIFVNAAAGNYRLGFSSPCVDNGDDGRATVTDLEGLSRVDVPGVGTTLSDRGAFEYQP